LGIAVLHGRGERAARRAQAGRTGRPGGSRLARRGARTLEESEDRMTLLVTGSAGHLGEALVRTLAAAGTTVRGLDVRASPFTAEVGSLCDREFLRRCLRGVQAVLHTAALHKPHLATHGASDFTETNVTGTALLLAEAVAAGVGCVVFTSSTSVFGSALSPPAGEPAAWITESVPPVTKNAYGATKLAAEALCERCFNE